MSYDELPPNSPPPSSENGAEESSVRDASLTDAPPAPRSRRRTKPVAPEAESAAGTPETEKPKRAVRSRKKPAVAPAAETHAAPAEGTLSSDLPAHETPGAEAPAAPRRRSPARKKPETAASVSPHHEAETPVPPVETPAPSSEFPDQTSQPTTRPSRRSRARRKAGAAHAAAEEVGDAVSQNPAEPAGYADTAPHSGDETASGDPERSGRRRRAPRSRRRGTAGESADATPGQTAEPAPPAIDAVAREDAEPSAESDSDAGGQSRRRRERGPRRGRGKTPVQETAAQSEEPVAIVVEPEAPTFFSPEPVEEVVDVSIGSHLVWKQGAPEIHINGVAYPPILFFGNVEGAENKRNVLSEVKLAAKAGVHLHSTLVELPCPLSESSAALDEIDSRLQAILEADPEGFVMPRVVFVPARGWKREYPTEISLFADGTTGDPSLTSDRFWQEAEQSLITLVARIQSQVWGARTFGYHLERGEWFQTASQGYDRSIANRDAFRDWLRVKYKNSLISLRASWHDGDVQFHTAEIPTLPAKPNPQQAFFDARRGRRYVDFNEFTSDSTARRLISLARVIKKATRNQSIVSVCYGYTLEFGHPASGHLALGILESAQAINLICGPPSYRDRKPGGAASLPAPVDSLALHNKLWLTEDDTKTYLAPVQQDPEDFNPRMTDRFLTEQAHARAIGRALAHTTGIGWMDLWGEGWLNDEGIWERLGALTERYAGFLKHHAKRRTPEVVALIDERSLLHVQRGENFLRRLTNGLHDTLQRSGASYGIYLQSDLLSNRFPADAKLYLFLTPYRLTEAQRAAVREKLQGGGKTLVWLYAPGTCEEIPTMHGAIDETLAGTLGMALRPQEWNSEVGSRVVEPTHAITGGLPAREIGVRERLNPSFYVDDKDAVVLAEYHGTGGASLAVKKLNNWSSVFIGDPVLPLDLLRGLCRYANVHLWLNQGEDIVFAGNDWVVVHAARDGQRVLRLPQATGLYDVTDRKLVADEATEYRFFLRAGMTRIFCVGAADQFVKLGLPNVSVFGRERIVLSVAAEARIEAAPPSVRSDLETLEAVLALDLSQFDAEDDDSDDPSDGELPEIGPGGLSSLHDVIAGEVIANGRRRRRRGGRGRWRKRAGAPGEGDGPVPPAVPPETPSE